MSIVCKRSRGIRRFKLTKFLLIYPETSFHCICIRSMWAIFHLICNCTRQEKWASTSNCAQETPQYGTINTNVNWFQWTVKTRNRRRGAATSNSRPIVPKTGNQWKLAKNAYSILIVWIGKFLWSFAKLEQKANVPRVHGANGQLTIKWNICSFTSGFTTLG